MPQPASRPSPRPSSSDSSGRDVQEHWRTFADQWSAFGSPLRPCAEDLALFECLLREGTDLLEAADQQRVWLLGVTPEIATATWIEDLDLVAVERVSAMIDSAWPGNADNRRAICADWLHAPFSDESFELVIGDGCLTVVSHTDDLSALPARRRLLVAAIVLPSRCCRNPRGCHGGSARRQDRQRPRFQVAPRDAINLRWVKPRAGPRPRPGRWSFGEDRRRATTSCASAAQSRRWSKPASIWRVREQATMNWQSGVRMFC